MKKILALVAILAIGLGSINAQDNLRWGVTAGMNVSSLNVTGLDSRVGFHAGVKAELKAGIEISKKYQFSIGYDFGFIEAEELMGCKNRNLMISLGLMF